MGIAMLLYELYSNNQENYSPNLMECVKQWHVTGTNKTGKVIDWMPPCNSHYCNLCGKKIRRKKVKEWKRKHAGYPHNYMLTIKFADFYDVNVQQLFYESFKDAIQYQDGSAIFSKINQWTNKRRHLHIIISTVKEWHRKELKGMRDKFFKKYNIPHISRRTTFGFYHDALADGFLDYSWRTGDKEGFLPHEYPPSNHVWSLTYTKDRSKKKVISNYY